MLIALRFYSNGAFQNTVGDVINVHGHYIHLPAQEEAAKTKQDFYVKSGLPGIVECIDGTHVRIQAPSDYEYLYVNRKGFHSIDVRS